MNNINLKILLMISFYRNQNV